MYKLMRLMVMVLMLASVSACGYQLQSRAVLPAEMDRTRLEIQLPYSEFARRIEVLLEQGGADVVTEKEGAATLEIPMNHVRKEIQSIGDNARVQEYLVRYTVQFRLLDAQDQVLIPMQTLEQSRVYTFTEQDILAAEREDEFLRKDLADILARMVVRRLGTYAQ